MAVLAFPRKQPLWRRLLALISGNDPFARPEAGFYGAGLPVGNQQMTVDGSRLGDVKWAVGTQASVLRDNPGWAIADGTATVTIDGVAYNPNLVGSFVIGADGGTFPIGGAGGTASHVHPFTHETAHGITQPVFDAPTTHGVTQPTPHVITQPAVNSHAPSFGFTEVATTPGTNQWVPYGATAGAAATALGHSLGTSVALTHNHDGVALDHNHDAPNRSVDVALSHNSTRHDGASVDAATGVNKYPPYVALWPLIKVYA